MKLTLIAAAALLSTSLAHAALVQGTPTPTGQPANPSPLFGTLISFDDVATGNPLVANHYVGQGVTSIASSIGTLGYYSSSQSGINYVGTGFGNNWNADILVEFASLQAAVGIGIAGPTTLQFELLDAGMNVLEGYNLSTTPVNTYYYINRLSNDTKFLHVKGNFVAIDDLQFDTKTVNGIPEPETYALMLAGLGVVGFMARRRKA